MIIKFKAGYKSYIVGDIAGFKSEVAEELVKKGYADYLSEIDEKGEVLTQSIPNEKFNFKKPVPKIEGLICAICGKKYKTEKGLKKHLWTTHKIK